MCTKSVAAFAAGFVCVFASFGSAHAECILAGSTVTCATDDLDGFDDNTNGLTVDVDPDVTVSNSGGRALDLGEDVTINNQGTLDGIGGDGIRIEEGTTVNNDGLIRSDDDEAIEASDEDDITVNNSGTIITTATGDKAIEADEDLTVINKSTGLIESTSSEAIEADGGGLTVINAGTIRAYVDDAIDGDDDVYIENTGTIAGGENDAIELNNGTVINSGTIISSSSALGEIDAGIDFDESAENGSVINSGLIEGEVGIDTASTNTGEQEITNSGHIVGFGGTSMRLGDGADTVNILQGSIIEGLIDFGDDADTDTLTLERGESWLISFVTDGEPEVIESNGVPIALINGGTTVATFDAAGTAFGADRDALALLTDTINDGLRYRLTAGNPTTYLWAQAFAARTTVEASGFAPETRDTLRGGMSGFSTPLGSLGRGGLFAGFAEDERDAATGLHDIDSDHTFGGAYARLFLGPIFMDGIVTAGRSDSSSTRIVANNAAAGGQDTLRADYDGWFVSPEVTLGTELAVSKGVKLVPSISAGYAGLYLDSFTETGSQAAVAFAERDIELIDGRAQLEARFAGTGWHGELRAGVKGWTSIGDDTISGVLASTAAFNVGLAGEEDSVAPFAGADITFSPLESVQIYAGGEAALEEGSDVGLMGRAGASVKF